ncbi:MAG: alpha/beta hydrolase [Pirellulales bacterium]|nr:alpha/beta hydrolase [Pirellulales bacterium]
MNELRRHWIARGIVVLLVACLAGCAGEASKSPTAQGKNKKSPTKKVAALPNKGGNTTSLVKAPKSTKKPTSSVKKTTVAQEPRLDPPIQRLTPSKTTTARPAPSAPQPSNNSAIARNLEMHFKGAERPEMAPPPSGSSTVARSSETHFKSAEQPLLVAPANRAAELPEMAPPPAPETSGALVLRSEMPATGDEPPLVTPAKSGYKVVKVFYGTDRAIAPSSDQNPWGRLPWLEMALAFGGVTLVSGLVWCVSGRGRVSGGITVFALLATVGLGVMAAKIPRDTKPIWVQPLLTYGNERGTLQVGTCEVTIPDSHEVGELESPSILKLEFNEDPTRHVVLTHVEQCEPNAFYRELSNRVGKSQRREAFVFVHGFNVTFEKAARRTAQLAHDLEFDGAPIFYSWPSQGGLLQYAVDETNVVWTVPHLKEFLMAVVEKTGAQRVHLIAHSMGNRALTSALTGLVSELKENRARMFQELVLTAPDIDAEIFRRDIAPVIVKTAQRVTLYASSNDEALVASKKIHGYPRAGESGENIVVVPGIETIDVSGLDTSLLGHSYYGDNDTVLADLIQLIHDSKPPNLRNRLKAIALGRLTYWVFLAENLTRLPSANR